MAEVDNETVLASVRIVEGRSIPLPWTVREVRERTTFGSFLEKLFEEVPVIRPSGEVKVFLSMTMATSERSDVGTGLDVVRCCQSFGKFITVELPIVAEVSPPTPAAVNAFSV
eukprot:scpid105296/ scgid12070/ 